MASSSGNTKSNALASPQYGALLLRALRRRRWLVGVLFLAVAGPFGAYSVQMPPRYDSTGMVWVEEPRIPVFQDFSQHGRLPVLLAILASQNLASSVVDVLPRRAYDELLQNRNHTDLSKVLVDRVRRLLGKPIVPVSPREQVISELLKARMTFTPRGNSGIVQVTASASDPTVASDIASAYIETLQSKTRFFTREETQAVREFLGNQTKQVLTTLKTAQENLVQYERERGVVKIDARVTQTLENLSRTEAQLSGVTLSEDIARTRLAAVKGQLEGRPAGKKVTEAILVPAPVLDLFEAWKNAATKLESLTQRYTDAYPQVRDVKEQAHQLSVRLDNALQEHLRITVSPNLSAQERTTLIEQALGLAQEVGRLQTEREAYGERIRTLRGSISTMSQEQYEFARHNQAVESAKGLHALLNKKAEEANIRFQEELRNVRILDPPRQPTSPSGRGPVKVLIMGLALALGAALGVPVGLELLDATMKTEDEAEAAFGWPVLGTVLAMSVGVAADNGVRRVRALPAGGRLGKPSPNAEALAKSRLARWWGKNGHRSGPARKIEPPLCIARHFDRMSPQAERYRNLRTTLGLMGQKTPFRTLLVTSLGPQEGKSTTLINLAILFWEMGRRVLVADGDLRRGCLHRVFGIPRTPGITDLILGKVDTVFPAHEVQPGFFVLPRGSRYEKPGVLLGSPGVAQAIGLFKERVDIVLLDSSPLLPVSDVLNLVSVADGVLVVVRAGRTSRRDGARARKLLLDAGANVLGLVLNGATETKAGSYSYYDGYYYGPDEDDDPDPSPQENKRAAEGLKRFS